MCTLKLTQFSFYFIEKKEKNRHEQGHTAEHKDLGFEQVNFPYLSKYACYC